MKGFLYNDVKGIIFSLLYKNIKIGIVTTIKTNVTLYDKNINNNFLRRYKNKWDYNTLILSLGFRIKWLDMLPSYYFTIDESRISIINGQVYIFINNSLKTIEQYGYQKIKTWTDIYNYLEKMYK